MKLKNIFFLAAIGLISACGNPNVIEFDVNAPGLTDATFIIKDDAGKSVFGENIVGGKCVIKSLLEAEGFYTLDIVKNGDKIKHVPFEVFLEPGKYTITANADKLDQYPQITSGSKRQQELTDYHMLINKDEQTANDDINRINKEIRIKGDGLSKDAYNNLMQKLIAAQNERVSADLKALKQYIKQNPQSEFAPHFITEQNYTDDPGTFYALYQLMSPSAQGSPEGKMINERLVPLLKLAPGKPAPAISGKTFDGKTFAQITAGKKLFVIDFWRAGNSFSRTNHQDLADKYDGWKKKGVEIISVSLDSKPLWWTTAVKDDKLPWPQMSDLKGNDSPNTLNWGITSVPTYDLVSGDWKIVTCGMPLSNIDLEINEYLAKHP